jgi:site-specific DNA-methyltransferase (adenine-specific)
MPEQLLGRIVRACSHRGELVLDPFGGSGTTAAVAKKLGRDFLTFEMSSEYAKRIRGRLKSIKVDQALNGAPEPIVSAPSTAKGRRLKSSVAPSKKAAKRKKSKKRVTKSSSTQATLPGID